MWRFPYAVHFFAIMNIKKKANTFLRLFIFQFDDVYLTLWRKNAFYCFFGFLVKQTRRQKIRHFKIPMSIWDVTLILKSVKMTFLKNSIEIWEFFYRKISIEFEKIISTDSNIKVTSHIDVGILKSLNFLFYKKRMKKLMPPTRLLDKNSKKQKNAFFRHRVK